MMRRTLRRLRFMLFAAITTGVIVLAVLVGLTQLAMPWLVRNPQRIEAFLSERLHKPVSIGHVSGAWIGGGPVLTLDQVQIGPSSSDHPPFVVPRAELAIDLYAPFVRNRAWSEFRLVGLDVELVHETDGAWQMRGLDLGDTSAAARPRSELSMGALGALVLKDLKLAIDDPRDDLKLDLGASELRVVNLGDITHVAGKVRNLAVDATPVDLIADVDINRRSGEFYAGGRDVDLGGFANGHSLAGVTALGGRGVAEIWVRVDAGRVDDLRLRANLEDATFSSTAPVAVDASVSVAPRAHFNRLAFVARWLRHETGWTLDVADLVMAHADPAPAPAELSIERTADTPRRYRAAATNLALEPIGSLAMLVERVPEGLRRWLYLAHPQGTLSRTDLDWTDASDFSVDATLRGAGFASADLVPGIERFDADLHGDGGALLLELKKQNLRIDYPHVFRKPFRFSEFGGDIVAFRTDAAWRVATDRVGFEGEGYGGELRGGIEMQDDHTRPLLDLYATVSHGDVAAAKLFWPTNVMPPKAVEWLDRALVSGQVDDGRVVVRGDLDSWPFHDNAGRFEARGHVSETVFEYSDEWPRAEHLSAVASFIDDSMQVDADSADVKGNRVASASATIADLSEPVLDLDVKGSGSGANLLGFLRATPIGKRYEDTLKDVTIGGKGDLAFRLSLPTKDVERLSLDGSVDLAGANLDDAAYNLHFVDAAGKVRFNQGGFGAGPLDVGFRQRPAKLTLVAGSYVADHSHALEATLVGRYPAATVFADAPDLAPLLAHFQGESEWTASLAVDGEATPGRPQQRLSLASDLRGISIDLPVPLTKSADAARDFGLTLGLPPLGQIFTAHLGDSANLRGRLPAPGSPLAVRVEFGGLPPDTLPPEGITVGGHASAIDAGGWLEVFERPAADGGGAGGAPLHDIDLRADAFTIGGRDFGPTRVMLDTESGATELKLEGDHVAGSLRIPGKDIARDGVTAHFARFHWPDPPPGSANNPRLVDIAPATLPPLHIAVDDFRLGSASFGAAQFESYPTAEGMHVEKLESKSRNVSMTATGDWTGSASDSRSHLVIVLTAQNLGRMMDALGFSGLIDGGQTKADIDATWPGPPSAFSLPDIESGSIRLKVAEGRILDVEPGAGRIFGLLSLTEIPRRLTLDFSDIFRSGFSFNSIVGGFQVEDGNAYTSDLVIKSPAADVSITGRTGLRTRDYDQQMIVTPHTSSTLPVVGAIAGGPVGAAAGIVLQGVLGRPLGKAMASRYQVSGSWDKPKITLVAREKTGNKKEAPGTRNDDKTGSKNGKDEATPPADAGAAPEAADGKQKDGSGRR